MSKIREIDGIVSQFASGQTVMVGGFMAVGTPDLLVKALVSSGVTNLTVVCNDAGLPDTGVGMIVAARGRISRYITSHVGLNPEFGKKMNNGEWDVELVPQGTLVERIRAGGMGLGGILTPTGVGTDVEKGKQVITAEGKDYLLELPLKGDIALIKAYRSDRDGNLIFRKSARNFNPIMATACSTVIVQADHIDDTGTMDPDNVMLPGIFVDYVVKGEDYGA